MTAHIYLLSAIALEIAGTFCLKLSNGFEKPVPSALAFVFYGLMNIPLILSLKVMPLSLVYAIWAGSGIVAAAAIGFVYFDEPVTGWKLLFGCLTLIGVVGLNWQLTR